MQGMPPAIQWDRIPEQGPIPPHKPGTVYTDNAEDVIRFVGPEYLLGDYNSRIGDNAIRLSTPWSPSRTNMVTMHPGDWVTLDDDGKPVVIPGYLIPVLFPEWVA